MSKQQTAIKDCNETDFANSVGQGITLVDFWAPWCGPCQMQRPILENVAQAFSDKVTVTQINVDDYPSLAQEFKVSGIPTLIIFKDGEIAKRFIGVQSQKTLIEGLRELL